MKRSGQRKHLSIPDLPLDIIFEILSYLNPSELLRATETCRTLYMFLFGPSSRTVWIRARANVPGLPPCPDDLDEREYARLVFETNCQLCNQGKSYELQTVRVWAARVRYCRVCLQANFVAAQGGGRKKSYPNELKALLPTTFDKHRRVIVCHSLDQLWQKEYKALKTDEERSQWTSDKIVERKKINAHAAQCEAWFGQWYKMQHQSRKELAESRKAKIMQHLRELGWDDEIRNNYRCRDLLYDRRVRRAIEQDTTEQALRDVIEYLNNYLQQAKKVRLAYDRG